MLGLNRGGTAGRCGQPTDGFSSVPQRLKGKVLRKRIESDHFLFRNASDGHGAAMCVSEVKCNFSPHISVALVLFCLFGLLWRLK